MTFLVVLDPENVGAFAGSGETLGIDISAFDGENDYISVALPDFPASSLDLENTFIDFTSASDGSFNSDVSDYLPFSSSVTSLTGSDDVELRLPTSLLETVDRTDITGVRFRITATADCTFYAMAVRVISADWVYAPIDINTLYDRVELPVHPTGSVTPVTRTNLARNPKAEVDTAGMSQGQVTGILGLAMSRVACTWHDGIDWCYRVSGTQPNDASIRYISLVLANTGTSGMPVIPNAPYTISAYVTTVDTTTTTGPSQGYRWTISWYDAAGVAIGSTAGGSNLVADEGLVDYRLSETFTSPAGAAFATAALRLQTNTPNDFISFEATGILLEQSSTTEEYFDGDSLHSQWSGTANNSASVHSAPMVDFPESTYAGFESWPVVYFSDTPSSDADPRPIDSEISLAFRSGSLLYATEGATNVVAVYLREIALAEQNQLGLNGTSQAALNALLHQPDYDARVVKPRRQNAIDDLPQVILDQHTQDSLERTEDYVTKTWTEVRMTWDDQSAVLTIMDANGIGYTFNDVPDLVPNRIYWLLIELKENDIRVRLHEIDGQGTIFQPRLYDTGYIRDVTLFRRTKGRIGWWANFADGDAAIENIRPRGFNFGEFHSKPYRSFTPVEGARVYAESTPDIEMFETLKAGPWGGEIYTESNKSKSGRAYRIVNQSGAPFQGVQTNEIYLDDLNETEVSFDLFFPSRALVSNLSTGDLNVVLIGENHRIVELHMPPFKPDQWTHVKTQLTNRQLQTGCYSLAIIQSVSSVDTTWYIDNISVKTRVVSWSARGQVTDPWGMNDVPWTPFRNLINVTSNGVLFERGQDFQIKGEARRQSARITKVKAIPKYAELGNFAWNNETPNLTIPPVPDITVISNSTRQVRLSASATGDVAYYYWSMGDGTVDFGPFAEHTYDVGGDYTVTLFATDSSGYTTSITETITV